MRLVDYSPKIKLSNMMNILGRLEFSVHQQVKEEELLRVRDDSI